MAQPVFIAGRGDWADFLVLHGVKKNPEVEGFGIFLWPHGNGTVRSAASVFLWGGGWLESGTAFPSGLRGGRGPFPRSLWDQYIMRGRNSTMSGTKTQRMMTPTVTKTKGRAL